MNDRITLNVEPSGRSGCPAVVPYRPKAPDEHANTRRVLLLDDDLAIQRKVSSYLAEHNMSVVVACSRKDIARQVAHSEPSLVILESCLDQTDRFGVLREIRSRSDVPVIIVSRRRDDEIDRVVGLELGADDYVTKPFGLRELLARIHAVLRRYEVGSTLMRQSGPNCFRFGSFQLDRHTRRLTNADAVAITLTKGEYVLLTAFLGAPQRPLSREQLLRATGVHKDVFDRSIDVSVLRLRRKLEPSPDAPRIIRTERGVGYVFCLSVELFETNAKYRSGTPEAPGAGHSAGDPRLTHADQGARAGSATQRQGPSGGGSLTDAVQLADLAG
jgi:DNA-binding response OmpR family regulator